LKKRPEKFNSKDSFKERIGRSIDLAVDFLQQGRIVAFPTETYYGLAVDPENKRAVERLYQLKKRPVNKPLLLLIDEIGTLSSLTREIPVQYRPIIKKYWPGPLTLIFPAADGVDPRVTAGTGTVGVRISPHPIAADLVGRYGKAITATSANISGVSPATTALEVEEMFGESIDYILDGGSTAAGLPSTIISIKNSKLQLIRVGALDISCIE